MFGIIKKSVQILSGTIFIFLLLFVFLNAAHAKGQTIESGAYELEKLAGAKDFSTKENPSFSFDFRRKQNFLLDFKDFVVGLFTDQYKGMQISAELKDSIGMARGKLKPRIEYAKDGRFNVIIDKNENKIAPGAYGIEIGIKDENLTGNQLVVFKQDFNWGVLAFNADKSQYLNGEQAYLQMAVLNETGHTLCDAQVFLEITAPDGGIAYLDTGNGLIARNPECGPDNIIETPDYWAHYGAGSVGVYKVKLRSVTKNGTYEISDSFEVVARRPIEIERTGPTRINPKAAYDMKIKLKAEEDFKGDITETVPVSFAIKKQTALVVGRKENKSIKYLAGTKGDNKELKWENVLLKKGETAEIVYSFDAPDVSPEFYLLGPLKAGSYSEQRTWQIASDAVSTAIYNVGNGATWTTPASAFDNTNNTYASRIVPRRSADDSANYLEGTANNVPANNLVITNVEIGLEGYVQTTDVTAIVLPRFGGSSAGLTHSVSLATADTDTVSYVSVYSDTNSPSTWTWADVQNMDVRVYGLNANNSQTRSLYVDSVSVRVTYNPNDAPAVSIASASQKADGSGSAHLVIKVGDNNADNQIRARVQYATGTACTVFDKAKLDETDTNTTSTASVDPKVLNSNYHQIGNSAGWITTSEGTNTVSFDWLEASDVKTSANTYCIAVQAFDGIATSSIATATLAIDNIVPAISNVTFTPASGLLKVGDTATATISSDGTGYKAGAITINGVDVSSTLFDNGDNTYRVTYKVAEGDTDIADSADLPISVVLKDAAGNPSAAYTAANAGARPGVDAHSPSITSVTITNSTYKIGDTINLSIAVVSDSDTYSLGNSTINGVTAHNLVKNSNTSYSVSYTVSEGDTDRAAGTIPISLVLRDTSGNTNVPYASLSVNTASIDAHRPAITALAIPNLVYKVGDTVRATATVTSDANNYNLGPTTINGVSAANKQKINDTTYTFDYVVAEGNTDRAAGTIPVSAVFIDTAGNSSLAFTSFSANTASIDAHTPSISSISFAPTSGILGINRTATATISALNSETGLFAGSVLTINNVDVGASFTEMGGGQYRLIYKIQAGDTNRADSDDLPVNIRIKDAAGNESAAYAAADPANRPGVDALAPSISSVSFTPVSGVLRVGQSATATISVAGSETGLSAGSIMTINGVDVKATFADLGGGQYRVVYTVAEGNNDIPDANDLPINFTVKDAAGNQSNSYTAADAGSRPGVDAHTPSVTAVAFAPTSGVLKVGQTATATISVSNSEAGLSAGSLMTINGVDVRSTFADLGGGQYRVVYTVAEGNNDIPDANDLPINFTVKDAAGNQSNSYTAADAGSRPGVDAHTPSVTNVVFAPTSGVLRVGQTATATISVSNSEAGLSAGSIMTINGVDVRSTFAELGGGQYRVVYTVSEGNNDILDANDLPVSLSVKDAAGNNSAQYTSADASNRPGVDAHTPSVIAVAFAPTSGVLKVGQTATATITAANSETSLLAGSIMTINGVDVRSSFAELGGGQYHVAYTVTEGDSDIPDASDLPINFTIKDTAGNQSNGYTAANAGSRPGVDAHTPSITSVVFAPTSGVLKVGQTATATISVSNSEAGLSAGSAMTINGVDVRSSFADLGGGQYRVAYTVREGDNDIPDSNDLPVSLSLKDAAGNNSAQYATADAGSRPGVDAHAPTIPGNLALVRHSSSSITVGFGAATVETNFQEYKIFYKAGTSGVTENDNQFDSSNDPSLGVIDFGGKSSTTISGLLPATHYVFNIWAYDKAGNKSKAAAELSVATNYAPLNPNQLGQYKQDGSTPIPNGDWSTENNIKLKASSTDPDMDPISYYFQFLPSWGSFQTSLNPPANACASGETYDNCSSKVWMSGSKEVSINSITDSATGYKWQVLACDDDGSCSAWTEFDSAAPNLKIDTNFPATPGSLAYFHDNAISVTLTLGAPSSDANFREYKIFYKMGTSGVTENDTEFSSSSDINLAAADFNAATSTTIAGLTDNSNYVMNIWAYDKAGNKTSATEITFKTKSMPRPPLSIFNSAAQKTDGSGIIDISVEVDDPDNDDTNRLRLDYVAGSSCDFSSPLDPTIDANSGSINADYGNPVVDNGSVYQIGTSSGYILTSPGSNTVDFDWLSKSDLPDASGVYCLRLSAYDGELNQLVPATTTVYIDNLAPTKPGNLSLNDKNTYSLVLNYGSTSTDENFSHYKVYYKAGISGVTENDTDLADVNLNDRLFNGNATTTAYNLSAGSAYVFNIWAYDEYGNKSSATEQSFATNHLPARPSGLLQKKNDNISLVANGGWTDENSIRMNAGILDSDSQEQLTAYFEMRPVSESFLTATSVPAGACSPAQSYATCASKVWASASVLGDYSSVPFAAQAQPSSVPDSSTGYKWQVLACDDDGACSDWADAGTDPNFKADTLNPTAPGNLSLARKAYNSLVLNFGTAASDANFREYIIYYKAGNSGVTENDMKHSSTSDANLLSAGYNGAASTTISGLSENTQYVFNIWAYDQAGRKAGATEISATTNSRPTGNLLSAAQKRDGSGKIDIAIAVSDANADISRARIDYAAGAGCDFSSPLKPWLDEDTLTATSTYGDANVNNANTYQIGNSNGWIITSSGMNTVNFDWLSQTNLPAGDGTYCLRLVANDQYDDQAAAATRTLVIDNKAPSAPGDLTLLKSTASSLTLGFGASSTESNFSRYRIFYKKGAATVNEGDAEITDANLNNISYNGAASTTLNGLEYNTQYSFKVYAYDSFGNKSNSGQVTFTTNAPPTGSFNSIAQKTDGSGKVDVSIEVYDVNLNDCDAKLEYVSGSACDFSSPHKPTLDESQPSISADYGTPTIRNAAAYQVGSSTRIITNQGSNTVNFDWLAASDIGGQKGVYCLRLTVNDGMNDQAVSATGTLYYDDAAPQAPSSLSIGPVTGMSVDLIYPATPGSDNNFKEYKIYYKIGTSGVTESDLVFDQNNDSNLRAMDFNTVPSTRISHLAQNTDYVFNIWIYDEYGNKASAGEVSTTTHAIESATWREAEDTPDPTAGNFLARKDNIRLRVDIANSGEYESTKRFDLQYGIKSTDCYSIGSWTTIPANAASEHFSFVTSEYVTDQSSTTPKLSNPDGYQFAPGYVVANPSSKTGYQKIGGNKHSEMEFVIKPTSHAVAGTTYCFRSTDDGQPLDFYRQYPIFTIAPLPRGKFKSVQQAADGSNAVQVSFEGYDANGDDSRARLDYVAGSNCDFSAPLDPTLDEADDKTSATYGDPSVDNQSPYQIGTTTGWIITGFGSTTVNTVWNTDNDLNNADGTYCMRLTFNDGYDDQAVPATTTVVVDQVNPSVPGNLKQVRISSNSATLGFGASSTDTNFKEYKIFYKEGSSGVTESDRLWGSSSDPVLGHADYNGTTTTTITGLEVNKQYVFRIWAYDKFGHKSMSDEETVVVIRYVARSENWGWYADQQHETPTSTLSGENITPIDITNGAIAKLRLVLREVESITGENIKIRLQFSTFADFSSDVNFVGEKASSSFAWTYGDGVDNDNDPVAKTVLSGTHTGSTHNESGISTTTYTHVGGTAAEWEFTLYANGIQSGTTYYFRAFDNTNNEPIVFNKDYSYPSALAASPNLSYTVGGRGQNYDVGGIKTTVAATGGEIDFGNLLPGSDAIADHQFIVNTNAGGGYQLLVYQRQNLLAQNGSFIKPVPYPNATPNAWPADPEPSAFGYHSCDDTLSGASPSRFSANNTYAAFENDFREISYSSIPVENESVDFIVRLQTGKMQEAGDYQTELVYILLPTFYE